MCIVLNSGHMVPMDVPEVALDMITKFLRGDSFVSGTSPLGSAAHAPIDAAECGGAERGGRGAGAAHHRNQPGLGGGGGQRSLRSVKDQILSIQVENTTLPVD